MSRKALIIIIGISVGLNVGLLGTLIYQHVYPEKPFPRRPDVFPELIDVGISLSPEQKGEIAEIMKGNQDKLFELREGIRAKKQELFFLMNQKEPDIKASMKIEDLFLIAAHRELRSYNFYSELAQLHSHGDTHEVLLKIANEELKHKEKMEYLYANTAFPQTSGG